MLIFWCLIINSVTLVLSQSLNSQCQVARSGAAGICRLLQDCPVVLNEIINESLLPTKCGYQNRKQIVCCPLPPTPHTTTTLSPNVDQRISAKKCAEYQDAVYERFSIAIGINEKPTEQKIFRCPITAVPLVVGGEKALSKEFPHMALIGFDKSRFENSDSNSISWACGGSLISENFILTAAHCLYERNHGYAKYVLLGELNYASNEDESQPQQFNVLERIKHPDFRFPSKYNDIALIKINGSVKFNQYIRPACLPESEQFVISTKRVIASGWGKTDFNAPPSPYLQKVVLELFTHQECNATYSNDINRYLRRGIIDETQLCAGSHFGRKDTCQGDSGGPIQVYHSSLACMYTVVGITSFGKSCGIESVPGVYTRVSAYLVWIERVVWEESDNFDNAWL